MNMETSRMQSLIVSRGLLHAHTGENMEDKKDRTPKHGTEIIPNFIKKVERTEKEIDANTPSITGDSQVTDLGQRPRLNWKKGYNRLAYILSVLWVLISFERSINREQFIVFSTVGVVVLWVVVPLLVYVIKWVIRGFTDTDKE